jgi:putative Holliday junction resolvase
MRFLGIDYGQRRIGLALSDPTGLLARPWKTIARQGNPSQVAAMLASEVLALQEEADGLGAVVIGFPRRLNGEEHEQSSVVRALAERLRRAIAVPLHLQDERLSSREAESLLARTEKDWRRRKALLDAAAAAVILQDFLDARASASAVDSQDSLNESPARRDRDSRERA